MDDGEGRGEGVMSGIPVVSDGGAIVGAILTANYMMVIKMHIMMCINYSQFLLADIGQKVNLKN